MELVLIHSNKINKEMIKVFNTPYIRVLQTKWIIKAIQSSNLIQIDIMHIVLKFIKQIIQ